MKWQIGGLMKPNLPLFLYYSKFGHFISVRKAAVEAVILVSGLKNSDITKHLAMLCLIDPDPIMRSFIAKSLMYYFALCCSTFGTCLDAETRKNHFKTQIQVVSDVWLPLSIEKIGIPVYNYCLKILEMAREFNPLKPVLKFKMPLLSTIKEVSADKNLKLEQSPKISSSPFADFTKQISSSKKLNLKKTTSKYLSSALTDISFDPNSSFEVIDQSPKFKKPLLSKTPTNKSYDTSYTFKTAAPVSTPVADDPVAEKCRKVLKKILAQKNSFWFKEPVIYFFILG
jgi:hypothetical protein